MYRPIRYASRGGGAGVGEGASKRTGWKARAAGSCRVLAWLLAVSLYMAFNHVVSVGAVIVVLLALAVLLDGRPWDRRGDVICAAVAASKGRRSLVEALRAREAARGQRLGRVRIDCRERRASRERVVVSTLQERNESESWQHLTSPYAPRLPGTKGAHLSLVLQLERWSLSPGLLRNQGCDRGIEHPRYQRKHSRMTS